MKAAFIGVFALAALASIYLVTRGGWPIAVLAGLAILSGIFYTAGKYPLGYLGFGDILVFIFFGPVAVAGTYYVQSLELNSAIIFAGVAPGLFSVAILTVNNLRDIDSDRKSGKNTLAVRFGRWLRVVGISVLRPGRLCGAGLHLYVHRGPFAHPGIVGHQLGRDPDDQNGFDPHRRGRAQRGPGLDRAIIADLQRLVRRGVVTVKIASFRFYKYALPLNRPIEVHGLKLTKREGLVIHLKSERDIEGFGEVAPLDGWSEESLNDAQEQVRELKAALTGRDILPGVEKLDGKMNSWFEEMNPPAFGAIRYRDGGLEPHRRHQEYGVIPVRRPRAQRPPGLHARPRAFRRYHRGGRASGEEIQGRRIYGHET